MPLSIFFPDEGDPPYEGPQTAADHEIYGFASPTESRPAPQLSQGELGIADRLNWDMDHNTQSRYTPAAYVSPWEAEGWGSGDVATTPPTRLQVAQEQVDAQPILAQRPGFLPGQKDYEYMPTEKEQRRERAANLATIARERGTNWQDIPLPGGSRSIRKAPEPTYGRWQDAKLPVRIQPVPDRDEVRIQPVPDRDKGRWGERIDWEPGTIGTTDWIDSDGDRTDDRYQTGPGEPREDNWQLDRSGNYVNLPPGAIPKRGPSRRDRAFNVRDTWRAPRAGRGMSTSSTRNLGDRGVITDRMKYYRR